MSFYHLPSACRNEIYALSGLVRPCPISLTHEHLRARNRNTINDACYSRACTYLKHFADSGTPRSKREREQFICFGPALSLSLFRVSKEISLEASSLFYLANKFLLRITCAEDLIWLSRLSSHAIASLRTLHVSFEPSNLNGLHELLYQWSDVLKTVSRHITPLQLSFALTFQSADAETVGSLIKSIKCLPRLRTCALSIGRHKTLEVRSLIQAAGAQATSLPTTSTDSFAFERLPQELRLKILQKTDLVQHAHPSSPLAYGSVYIEHSTKWASLRHKCCSRCNDCLERCTCIWKPAAYSTTCICRPLPTALFLVSRCMSSEAQEVFFSSNLFILAYPLSSIAFLERLNAFQLSRIRRIELYFRENDAMAWWNLDSKNLQTAWRHVIRMLRTQLNLEKLELRVNLARLNDPSDMHEPDMDELTHTLKEILDPLKSLRGIYMIFLYLGHFEGLEKDAEKEIMGDAYSVVEERKPPAFHDFV